MKLLLLISLIGLTSCSIVPTLGIHKREWCERDYRTGDIICEDARYINNYDPCDSLVMDYGCRE